MNAPRILVVGDALLDRYWEGAVDRVAPQSAVQAPVPVPVLRVTRRFDRAGGAANVAVNLAALGAAVSLVALVGDDAEGESLAGRLDSAGVAFDRVVDPEWATIVKLRCVTAALPVLRVDFETPAPARMRPRLAERVARALPVHDVVVLSDYGKGALDDCAPLVQAALAMGKPVLVDPKGADWSRYAGATLLKPDLAALRTVLGDVVDVADERELQRSIADLRRRHDWRHLVLTRSEAGMTLFHDAGVAHEPARVRTPEAVRDVTGAGDTVLATLAWRMAEGDGPLQAMRWAGIAAGIAVQRFGNAAPTREELVDAWDERG